MVLGLSFDYFFYDKLPGISFPFYVILVMAGFFIIAKLLNKPINREVFWLLAALIFFSTMVFVRSSFFLTFLNVIASLLLLLIIAEVSFGKKVKNFFIVDYIKIFFLPFKFFHSLLYLLSQFYLQQGVNKERKVIFQIVKGVLMALPVLFVFLLLFSSADIIFQKYISDLINLDNKLEFIFRSIFILLVTLVFMGAYTYIFRERKDQVATQRNCEVQIVGYIESSILLVSVNILFAIFIFFQFTYLFGGESNLSAKGITYAEYAHRGFFELIVVAIISLLLLLSIEKFLIKQKTEHGLEFKILSTILVIQVIIIMVSSYTRLSLYENAYGFTTLRLYSHALNILLAAIFCLYLYKIYQNQQDNTFYFYVFISIILFLAFMNFLNPDLFITQRNIDHYNTIGELDIDYLNSLSEDSIPAMIKGLAVTNDELRKNIALQLYRRAQNIDFPAFNQWQSFNISRMRADKILHLKMLELELYNK